MEKITANLKHMDSKRDCFRKSLLTLGIEWRDIEDTMDSVEKTFEEGVCALDESEDDLNSMSKSVAESKEEIGLLKSSLESRLEELNRREEKIFLYEQERIEYLRTRVKFTEDLFGEISRSAEERLKEADLREEMVESKLNEWEFAEESIRRRSREVDKKEDEYECRSKDLDNLHNLVAKRLAKVKAREKECEGRWNDLMHKEKEVEVLGKKYTELIENFNVKEKELQDRFKEFDLTRKLNEESGKKIEWEGKELDSKIKQFKGRSKELMQREKDVEVLGKERLEELKAKERQFEVRWKELLHKESEIEVLWQKQIEDTEDFNVKEKELRGRSKVLEVFQKLNKETEKKIELECKELESKQKQFDSVEASFNQSLKEFHLKKEQFKLDKEMLEKHIKELDLKREELAEKSKENQHIQESLKQQAKKIELERKQIKIPRLKDQNDEKPTISGSSSDICFVVTMNGENLQLFLNENSNNHSSMFEEVLKMLRLSRDPSMLVLDAMEGFYPPHLSKEGKTFETSIVRRSCILLLQQFGKISMQIQSKTKERALRLAEEWKRKINLVDCNSLEVFGLLHLLASYGLVPDFDAVDIIKLLDFVAEDDKVFELCGIPCFAEKVPDLIKELIEKSRFIVAVRFICKLDLVTKFPPVPLLKKHIELWRKIADSTCKSGKNTLEAQNKATDERIASLSAVVSCILDFDLQSEYPPTILQFGIEQMLKKKSENKDGIKQMLKEKSSDEVKLDPLVNTDSIIVTQILANMDAKSLLQFLSKHLSELELMQIYVSKVLNMSSDPGKFVIVALEEFRHSFDVSSSTKRMSKRNISIMRSFLFVLELLADIPFEIEIPVLEAAKEVAVDWKAKLSLKENPVHILAFLQLVFTYKLTPGFDPKDLYNLCCSVSDCKELPGLSEILALSEKVPVSKILNVQDTIKLPVSKRAPLNSLAEAKVPDLIRLSSDPSRLLLDVMQCCYFSNLEDVNGAKSAMGVFVSILKNLLKVTMEIYPRTQAEALRFAAFWKAKLLENTSKNQEVLCFVLFLSVYKLVSLFGCDELLCLLNFHDDKFTINLLQQFNLDNRMPELIEILIAKERQLDALICIYAYKLFDKFPPVPILKSYLGKICDKEQTLEALGMEVDEEITALQAVIKSMGDRGLTLPNDFSRRVKALLLQKKIDGENVSSISRSQKPTLVQAKADGENVPSISQSQKHLLIQEKANGENVLSISQSQSQKPKSGRIIILSPSPTTDNKEHTKLLPSQTGKKRSAPSSPHGSKRKAVLPSSAEVALNVCIPYQSPSATLPLRCPDGVYAPSFTYCLDQTSHITPNTQSWQCEPRMAHIHDDVSHFPSFSGANPVFSGPGHYEWPYQNHFDPNYISRNRFEPNYSSRNHFDPRWYPN
ncbi:uncharacterized protein LOC124926214 [Impatiens glandulifera]|uniref:uncharacterized protein LOC124926214 n=1 Tax=Impatiens glandulifera TaxID=253017 RepID=UPI001FB08753|nr:uncharacterized protein LOC124926214 [Impatiens glandulifera]